MNKIKLFKNHKLGLFFIIFAGVFSSFIYYNILSMPMLEKKISIRYQEVVDVTKRFHSYYVNANEIQLKEGLHNINNVGVIVNKTGAVKVLSPAMILLHKSLSEVFDKECLWTVAVIEKLHDENTGNSYFKPLRDTYITFNDKSLHDSLMLDRIVKLENIDENYKGFHDDDIRITEVYEEQWTNERIHSVIYPIYLETKLVSVIIVDFKEGWNDLLINKFNNKIGIFIDNKPGLDWLTYKMRLPYTSKNNTHAVSIAMDEVFWVSLYITTVIYGVAFCLYAFYLKIDWNRRYDRMTMFYRRDYYETKLEPLEHAHVLMIDIDHFKNVNDNHGHDVGDNVIKQVAQRIRENIRAKDIAIRWGGEEFIIIFDDMYYDDFAKKTEELRLCIAANLIENITITISLGGVEQKESESAIDAIQRADVALYQSKNSGRNKVTLHKNNYGEE